MAPEMDQQNCRQQVWETRDESIAFGNFSTELSKCNINHSPWSLNCKRMSGEG